MHRENNNRRTKIEEKWRRRNNIKGKSFKKSKRNQEFFSNTLGE